MTLNELKAHFILKGIKSSSTQSGSFGEAIAKSWLKDEHWDLLDLNKEDQDFFSCELYEKGGKKPDLIGVADGIEGVVLWDAKFHNALDEIFKLPDEELKQYKALHKYFCDKIGSNDAYVFFMVMPKCYNGTKMYLVNLGQFDAEGTSTEIEGKPATQINLNNEDCYDTSKHQKAILEKWGKH